MDGLVELASKYLPELDKIGEAGDGNDELKKILYLLGKPKEKKHISKKPKKQHDPHNSSRKHRSPSKPKRYPQRPSRKLYCKMGYTAPMMPPYAMIPRSPYHSKPRKHRPNVRSSHLKSGTVIGNVSNALETFKKKRDKFLLYLQRLQTELTELNLPSLSSENMALDIKKRSKKEKSGLRTANKRKKGSPVLPYQRDSSRVIPLNRRKKFIKKKGSNTDKRAKPFLDNILDLSSDGSSYSESDSE